MGKGFIFDGNAYTELLPPGFNWAESYAINNTGTVVGSGIDDSDYPFKGFVYRDGQYTSLLPPGWSTAVAYDVSDSGVVVGCGQGPLGDQRFIYDRHGYTELRPPRTEAGYCSGGPLSIAINDLGVVAGTSYVEGGGVRPFFRWHGGYHFLRESGWPWTSTSGINLWGTIVGLLMDSEGYRGFSYSDGRYTVLLPPGWHDAVAHGINDLGIVVGRAVAADHSISTGFAYWNGTYTEIMPPGWITAEAYRLNNRGVVVGSGYDGSMGMGFVAVAQSDYRSLP